MQVFKFGGASVKDASGVKNLAKVLQKVGHEKTLIVVSAMGKTTNALEVVINNYFNNKKELQSSLQEVKKYHNAILLDLFENEQHPIFKTLSILFDELNAFLKSNKSADYNFVYDQVIGYGELVSTRIISGYLNETGFQNDWLDVREFIKTDNYYRRANVHWEETQALINKKFIFDILEVDNVKDYIDVYLFGIKQPQDKYNVVISGNNIVITFVSDVTRLPGEVSVNDFEIKGKIAEIL